MSNKILKESWLWSSIGLLLLAAPAFLLADGCGSPTAAAGAASQDSGAMFNDAKGNNGTAQSEDTGANADQGSPGVDLPKEQEKHYDFGAPEGSPNFVYIPAAGTDNIVKVSGATLKVTLIEVGDHPTRLKVVPGQDAAVVLNSGSDDLSVVRSTDSSDTVDTVAMLPHCNALTIDPSGKFAVAYFDLLSAQPTDPTGNFQAVTLVKLDVPPQSMTISIGFRPRSVDFTPDGKKALIVTDDGISVLELSTIKDGDIVVPVPISLDPLDKPQDRAVRVTADARWALIRASNIVGLYAVHLATKKLVVIPMTSVPTDLDLTPDGTQAIAVLRDSKEVAIVQLPSEVTNSLAAEIISVGSLTAGLALITDDSQTAVLYTSVQGIEQVATLDLKTHVVAPVLLRKTVDFIVIPPGSRKAILVHKPAPGPNNKYAEEAFVDKSEGYTLFDLDNGFTKLVLTATKLSEIAHSESPSKSWILLPDPAGLTHNVQEIEHKTFLTLDHAIGSSPEHVRFLKKASTMAVTQTHPSGRITFFGTNGGAAKTVTGYELNGLVK